METDGPDAGGEKSALDLTTENDRGMVRRFLTRHKKRVPGIDPARIAGWLDDLELVRKTARQTIANGGDFYPSGDGGIWDTKLDGARALGSAIKTEAMLEGMNQADDHKAAQLESDAANPGGNTTTVNVGVVNALDMTKIAADPERFKRLMALAEAVQTGAPIPHTNGKADAHGRNGTKNGTH